MRLTSSTCICHAGSRFAVAITSVSPEYFAAIVAHLTLSSGVSFVISELPQTENR